VYVDTEGEFFAGPGAGPGTQANEKQRKMIPIDREVSEEKRRGPAKASNSVTGRLPGTLPEELPPTQQEGKECRVM
jgi:hypothetical protein